MKYTDEMTAGKSHITRMKTCPSATLSTENPTYTARSLQCQAGDQPPGPHDGMLQITHAVTDTQHLFSNRPLCARNNLCSQTVGSFKQENENEVTVELRNSTVLINLFCFFFPLQIDRTGAYTLLYSVWYGTTSKRNLTWNNNKVTSWKKN
jgi:hypothetical protein